jgi:predicted  nucleic acid-binding Zn-ribbon protein
MASPDLQRLWKLAQVDYAIEAIKKRAATMDIGQDVAAQIQEQQRLESEEAQAAKALRSELTDLELNQRGIADKIKKFDKQMYGGSLVSPKEAENLQKEIALLNKQRAGMDERVMELWELVPPAEAKVADRAKQIDVLKQQLTEKRKQAVGVKSQIEEDYKRLMAARPQVANDVRNPTLLAKYESIRQRHAGKGMAEITKSGHCSACGTHQPERTIELLKDGRPTTCESCHRLLYFTEGVI